METEFNPYENGENQQVSNSVYISNLNPSTEYKTLHEFFSFCGDIVFLKIFKIDVDSSSAIIVYGSEEAVKTSLLLTKATIDDHLIKVEPATQDILKSLSFNLEGTTPQGEPESSPKPSRIPSSASTTIASLIAKGYQLSDTATEEAKRLDSTWSITDTIKTALDGAKENLISFDEKYQLSEKAKNITNSALDSAKEIDGKLHISEKSNSIGETANSWFSYLTSSIQESLEVATQKSSEFVESNFGGVMQKFKEMTNNFNEEIDIIKKEANAMYEEGKEKNPEVELENVANDEVSSETIPPDTNVVEQ